VNTTVFWKNLYCLGIQQLVSKCLWSLLGTIAPLASILFYIMHCLSIPNTYKTEDKQLLSYFHFSPLSPPYCLLVCFELTVWTATAFFSSFSLSMHGVSEQLYFHSIKFLYQPKIHVDLEALISCIKNCTCIIYKDKNAIYLN